MIEVLNRTQLKSMLLECLSDAELATLIDTLVDERTVLAARAIVAPADVEDRAAAMACEMSIRDFRAELERRKAR